MNLECLDTVVQNASGAAITVSLLPPHGVVMAADEMMSFPGDLVTRLANNKRKLAAYKTMLADGKLKILRTPAVVLLDATTDLVKTLSLDNGTLGTSTPCWSDDPVYSSDGEFTPR